MDDKVKDELVNGNPETELRRIVKLEAELRSALERITVLEAVVFPQDKIPAGLMQPK